MILSLSLSQLEHARGDFIHCSTSDDTPVTTTVVGQFHVFRPGQKGFDIRWRDLEFMWGVSYSGGLNQDAVSTLNNYASTLIDEVGKNPFAISLSKTHLTYNYFSLDGATYNSTDPNDSTSMVLARQTVGYNNIDRSHVDAYLEFGAPSQRPAVFTEVYEDTSTGHAVNVSNPALTDVKPKNSINLGGPGLGFHVDLGGDGWTHPDSVIVTAFLHEFVHGLSDLQPSGYLMDEMFANAAEAMAGISDTTTRFEVPYTWPLLYAHRIGCITSSGDCCTNPRDANASNYQGRSLFTAYLAYNFRGADTSTTANGLNDDLLRRWARATVTDPSYPTYRSRHFGKLVELMGDDSCGTCVGKSYFRPGGTPLNNHDRTQLLLHNWRVATYVDRFDLPGTEGQYGFPPHFGFSPAKLFKAWQDVDACSTDDIVALPPVVTLGSAHLSREMSLLFKREFRGSWYPLRLKPTGAEYWVIRADTASLGTATRDLVITVATDSVFRFRYGRPTQQDGRLMASVVAYTHRAPDEVESPQWQNPQWAQLALEPQWADADSLPNELVFVVPGFGLGYKAAVLVISLADGPTGALADPTRALGSSGVGSSFVLPYRVSLALRGAPNDTLPNPRGLHLNAEVLADHPTWSPLSDEVAFTRFVPATGESRIYRQRLDGSPPVPLASGSEPQGHADWSPRGDWIALAQPPAAGPASDRHIWLFSPTGSPAPRELTDGADVTDRWPAIQPNGQSVAYARLYWYFDGSSYSERWQLRRKDLDGTGDVPLVHPGNTAEIKSVRWSPDGWLIYFTRNDSLYSVSRDNGTVIAQPEMLAKASSLDFHLSGTNRFVAEQVGIAGSITNPQLSPVAFRRLVLRDVAATDTRSRFYRTGAEFYHPRWSPDGLRVAYSSNQNTANISADRDLFVGQVSFNQPPQFQGLVDLVVDPSQSFQMFVNATDPNGETITYDMPAIYLPPGASFNPGTRSFTWPTPGPQGSVHFLVVRAFDGSGGVANRVLKLTVKLKAIADLNSELVGDTQAWLSWTAPGQGTFQGVEYDLRYAPFVLSDNTWSIAARWTVPAPAAPGTPEATTVSGLTPCTPYWFAIKAKDSNGDWSAISNVFSVTTLCGGGGGEFRAQQRGPAVAGGRPGIRDASLTALAVEMDLIDGAPSWSLRHLGAEELAALGAADSVSVVRQARDSAGRWIDHARIERADAAGRYGVRSMRTPGRLIFLDGHGARQAWNVGELDRSDALARLVSARHSRLGGLEETFDERGSTSLDVAVGDTIVLAFATVAEESPVAPRWFLLVGPPGSEVSSPAFARPDLGGGSVRLPTAIALRQNQPNPFSLTTDIHFELPAAAGIRLEVFDLQGRRVVTLADGPFPAGFHAIGWDRRDGTGARVRPGIYLYRLETANYRDQKKMTVFP